MNDKLSRKSGAILGILSRIRVYICRFIEIRRSLFIIYTSSYIII
jgi:hypothetical protein